MSNPVLHKKNEIRDQLKAWLSNTFGADTNKRINKTLMDRDTIVLAFVFLMSMGLSIQGKLLEC